MDSGYSGTPSPVSSISSGMVGSPMSQTSDMTTESNNTQYTNVSMCSPQMDNYYNMDSIHPVHTFGSTAYPNEFVPYTGAELVIIEQPVEKFRFRYKSEMHGTHGSLMGIRTEKSKKTYPTVELRGYNGEAAIFCSLYQADSLNTLPHSHRLVVRNGDMDMCDPHELTVSPEDGYRAVFQGMGIIHTAKKHIAEELITKMKREKMMETRGILTPREEVQIKTNAERFAKNMNLNQVCLGFQAFAINSDKSLTKLCEPVFSKPINNMKSALTGELKITRLSAAVSSVSGGEDLFLFVEKVGKKNIRVRFFEIDDNEEEIWENWGVFSEADVHHQYAIALRTPPYKDREIDHHVEVFIQLVRPSDNDRSEPMPFKYKPRDVVSARKRARTSSTYNSSELPVTIMTNFAPPPTISNEFNKQQLLSEFFSNRDTSKDISEFIQQVTMDSDELEKMVDGSLNFESNLLETDSVGKSSNIIKRPQQQQRPSVLVPRQASGVKSESTYTEQISRIYAIFRKYGDLNPEQAQEKILTIFEEANANDNDIIHNAIRNGDSNNMVKLLRLIDKLQLNKVLQNQNEQKETCLHIVCLYDKPEYIRPLINLGANPNLSDMKGNTPLHIAVEENMIMCASRIIERGNYTQKSVPLQINCANDEGLTPLHLAVMKGNLSMVQRLLQQGSASTKLCISKNGNNVLHLAIQQNDTEIVKYLLNSTTTNINEANAAGFTPLRLANSMDNISNDIVKMLVKSGANEGDVKLAVRSGQVGRKSIQTADGSKMDMDETSSEDDDDDEKQLTIDEKYRNDSLDDSDSSQTSQPNKILFDDDCIKSLSAIFNKDDRWKKLAQQLKLNNFINIWSSGDSTKMMFTYINNSTMNSNTKLKDVIGALGVLGELDSIKIIHKMQMKMLS